MNGNECNWQHPAGRSITILSLSSRRFDLALCRHHRVLDVPVRPSNHVLSQQGLDLGGFEAGR